MTNAAEIPPSAAAAPAVPSFMRVLVSPVEVAIGLLFVSFLAMLALPYVRHEGSVTRVAQRDALFDSVRAAAQIAHASARVRKQTERNGSVEVDGTRISTIYGFPAASSSGIVAATGTDPAIEELSLSGGGAQPGSTLTIRVKGAPGECAVIYTAPDAPGAAPQVAAVNTSHPDVPGPGDGLGC